MGRKEGGREDGELERRRRGGGGRDRRDKEGGKGGERVIGLWMFGRG